MRKIKSVITTIVLLAAALSLIVAANASIGAPNQTKEKKDTSVNNPGYMATITYHIYEGEGCECIPLINVPIAAQDRDSDHNDSNVTNDEGMCTLHLNYDHVYRVSITADGYESVLYDFLVIDNQPFIFNLKKTKIDSEMTGLHFLDLLLQRFSHFRQ